MNDIYVIDGWLEQDLVTYLLDYQFRHLPVYHNHQLEDTSVIGVHLFKKYNTDRHTHFLDAVMFENYIIDYLYFKLKKIFMFDFKVLRAYLNYYPANIFHSKYHIDGDQENQFTVLYMLSKTPKDKSGAFEYVDPVNNKATQIDYLQNRLIVFKSNIQHRGLSFNNNERLTLTFKCVKIDENSTYY